MATKFYKFAQVDPNSASYIVRHMTSSDKSIRNTAIARFLEFETLSNLKKEAKARGIKDYSSMTKPQLAKALAKKVTAEDKKSSPKKSPAKRKSSTKKTSSKRKTPTKKKTPVKRKTPTKK